MLTILHVEATILHVEVAVFLSFRLSTGCDHEDKGWESHKFDLYVVFRCGQALCASKNCILARPSLLPCTFESLRVARTNKSRAWFLGLTFTIYIGLSAVPVPVPRVDWRPWMPLTQMSSVDYNVVKTKPAMLSGLAFIILP